MLEVVAAGPEAPPAPGTPTSGSPPSSDGPPTREQVGGPIRPTSTIYFGRPPGTENRPAGAAALAGAVLLLAGAAGPWAVREGGSGATVSFGWRDATGGLGPGWAAAALGLLAVVLAGAALAGRTERWMRIQAVVVGLLALAVAGVEGARVRSAGRVVEDLTGGEVGLGVGWGLAAVAAGGVALLVAAWLHRSQPPAWRRG